MNTLNRQLELLADLASLAGFHRLFGQKKLAQERERKIKKTAKLVWEL